MLLNALDACLALRNVPLSLGQNRRWKNQPHQLQHHAPPYMEDDQKCSSVCLRTLTAALARMTNGVSEYTEPIM